MNGLVPEIWRFINACNNNNYTNMTEYYNFSELRHISYIIFSSPVGDVYYDDMELKAIIYIVD